ncbi:MAG: hypothetical protein WC408_03125 [Candidatus Micrarchaeia archaeon]|jgi:hypothetical protein
MESPHGPEALIAESIKELRLESPGACKTCESVKCADIRVAHCCEHELSSFDEFRIFFFGVIFHELSHFIAAKLAGIKVVAYKLWHPKAAWVRIQNPQKTFNDAFISFAPLFFGSIAASLLFISLYTSHMWDSDPLSFYVLLYIAISIAVHSPISKVDAYAVAVALGLSYLRRKNAKGLARLTAFLVWPFYFFASFLYKLAHFWFALVQYLFLVAVFLVLAAILFVH